MFSILTLELDNLCNILFVAAPEDAELSKILPKVGDNLLSYWDDVSNAILKDYFKKVFSTPHAIELSINLNYHFIEFTAHHYTDNKAFVYCKLIAELPHPKSSPPQIEGWGFKKDLSNNEENIQPLQDSDPHFFYKNIANNLPIGIVVFNFFRDGSFVISYTNKEVEYMLPTFNKDLHNENNNRLFERIHPDDREMVITAAKNIFELKEMDVEYRFVDGDKTIFTRLNARPSINTIDNSVTVYAYLQDISEKKRIEEKLKLADFALKKSHLPILLVEEDGALLDFNDAATELYGYPKEEFAFLKTEKLSALSANRHAGVWGDLKASKYLNWESIHKKKDGTLINVEVKANFLNFEGRWISCSFITDISEKKQMEKQIKLVDHAFRNASVAIHFIQEDGSIYDFNNAAYTMFGYSKEEYKKLTLFDLNKNITPDTFKIIWGTLILESNDVFYFNLTKKNGEVLDVEVRSNKIVYGDKVLMCSSFIDITEKKKIEENLHLVDYAFRTAAFPMYFIKSDGRIHDFNKSIHETLGYTREEFKDITVFDLSIRHTPETWPQRIEELKSGTFAPHYTKMKKKGGATIDVEMRTNFFEFNNQFFATSSFIDITERKKTENQLSLVYFSFNNVSTAIIYLNKDGEVYDCNEAFCKLNRLDKSEVIHKKVFDFRWNYTPQSYKEYWDKVKKIGSFTYLDKRYRKDGTLMDVEINPNFIHFGDIELICTFTSDITEKKKLQDQLQLIDFSFRHASTPISFIKEDGSFYDFNDATCSLLGYRREEYLNLSIPDINPLFDMERWVLRWKEIKAKGGEPFITKLKKKDGTLLDIEVRANIIQYDGVEINCATYADITEKKKLEEQLKLIDFAFKESTTAIIFVKEDRSFFSYNDAALKLYGYTKEEMSSISIGNLTVGHTKDRWDDIWKTMKTQGYFEVTRKQVRKDGSIIDVEIKATYVNYGGLELNCSFITDITEKKKSEKALKRSIARYEYATNATSDVIWEHDLETDQLFYSKNFTNVFGHELTEEWITPGDLNNIWWKNIHPEDFKRAIEFENEVLNGDGSNWQSEYRLRKVDGTYALVFDRGFALKDENGKVFRWIGAMQDITEKRKIEVELKRSIERYEYATIATSEVVWEADFENNTYYLTSNFVKLFGHEANFPENNTDNRWLRNIHPEDLQRVLSTTQKVINGEESSNQWKSEYRLKKANGEYAIIQDKSFAIRNENGKVVRLVGALEDITKRREEENEKLLLQEELIQNNRELKQFGYITSHNLRAPLTNLISICKLLKTDKIQDARTLSLIEGFKVSTYHLHETLEDLIKVLIIKEKTNLSLEILNFEQILEKVKDSIFMELVNHVVTIEADFQEAPNVKFSKPYMESIFLNLLTNAIKYSNPERYPIIKINSRKASGGKTILTFSDNGMGMDMRRVKDKIFGLYQRFHSNSDSKGIGLYLIQSQITALGGKIEVESEVGVGTTFTVTFK